MTLTTYTIFMLLSYCVALTFGWYGTSKENKKLKASLHLSESKVQLYESAAKNVLSDEVVQFKRTLKKIRKK